MILSTADTAPHETPRSVYKRCKIDPFSFLACFQSTIALHRRSTPTKKKLFSSSSFNQRINFATHNRLFHPLQFYIVDASEVYFGCKPYLSRPNAGNQCHIGTHQIWSAGVSLWRPSKMQFRRPDLKSIGRPNFSMIYQLRCHSWFNPIYPGGEKTVMWSRPGKSASAWQRRWELS